MLSTGSQGRYAIADLIRQRGPTIVSGRGQSNERQRHVSRNGQSGVRDHQLNRVGVSATALGKIHHHEGPIALAPIPSRQQNLVSGKRSSDDGN